MGSVLAGIFRQEKDLECFARAVASLEGDFELDAGEMTALGQAYFERYPDRVFDRNMEEVRLGYSLARVCILEKALAGADPEMKDFFRRMFVEPSTVEASVREAVEKRGAAAVADRFRAVSAALSDVKETIDALPRGMIKERFLGGISGFFNVMYLVRIFLGRLSPESLQSI